MTEPDRPGLLMMGPMHPDCMAALPAAFEVHRLWEAADPAGLLARIGPRIRAVATDGVRGCPAEVLAALPRLEIVASFGVGVDAIPLAATRARGIRVTNTPDVLNDAVAELCLGLMIALARRIPEADAHVRTGAWGAGSFPLSTELTGATAGLLGMGRIGGEIARRLAAMRMRVIYHARRPRDVPYPFHPDLVEMARAADWLVVIAPGGEATRGIVSRAVLEALGARGRLVNVARGSLVDEPALVELLAAGRLGGAALDVFADEPVPDPRLLALPNVLLSPHVGSATTRTRAAMARLVIDNLAAHFAGRPLPSEVTG